MRRLAFVVILIVVVAAGSAHAQQWLSEMRGVHQNYDGTGGKISRIGDSISYSQASFSPLRYSHANTTAADDEALAWIQSYMNASSWSWQDDAVAASHGCFSGWRSYVPLQTDQSPPLTNINYWLGKDDPGKIGVFVVDNPVSRHMNNSKILGCFFEILFASIGIKIADCRQTFLRKQFRNVFHFCF